MTTVPTPRPSDQAVALDAARTPTEYDVCVNAGTDASLVDNGDGTPFSAGDIVTAVGMMLPKGTIIQGAVDQTCASYAAMRIGTSTGGLLTTSATGLRRPTSGKVILKGSANSAAPSAS